MNLSCGRQVRVFGLEKLPQLNGKAPAAVQMGERCGTLWVIQVLFFWRLAIHFLDRVSVSEHFRIFSTIYI